MLEKSLAIAIALVVPVMAAEGQACKPDALRRLVISDDVARVQDTICPYLEAVEKKGFGASLVAEGGALALALPFCTRATRQARFLCGLDEPAFEALHRDAKVAQDRATTTALACAAMPAPCQLGKLLSRTELKALGHEVALPPPLALTRLGAVDRASLPAAGVVDIVAKGLADFLVSRANVELQLHVVDTLRGQLCGAGSDAARLAPHTCAFLGGKSDFFSPGFGRDFVAAVRADVEGLPRALLTTLGERLPHNAAGATLRVHMTVIAGLFQSQRFTDILARVDAAVAASTCDRGAEQTTCQAVVEALRAAALIVDVVARNVVSEAAISAATRDRLVVLMSTILDRPLTAEDQVELDRMIEAVRRVRATIAALSAPNLEPQARVELALTVVADFVAAFNEATPSTDARLAAELVQVAKAIARADYPEVLTRVLGLARAQVPELPVPDIVLRVLSLGATLGSAKSPEEAQAMIESFAAPVGSWRLKRGGFGVYLNGLVGFGAGGETLVGDAVTQPGVSFQAAFMGAVGIDLSYGPRDSSCTYGLFLSVIDVGALASVRSDGDQAAEDAGGSGADAAVAVVGPGDPLALLAPGAYFRVGLGDTPLVLGLGVSWVPAARALRFSDPTKISDQETRVTADAVRYMAFLAVDVVIMPLGQ